MMKLTRYALLAVIVLFTSQVHTVVTADDLEQVKQRTYKYKEDVKRLMERRAELSSKYSNIFEECFIPRDNGIIRLLPLTEDIEILTDYSDYFKKRNKSEMKLLVEHLKELKKSYEKESKSKQFGVHYIDQTNKLYCSLYVLEPKSKSCKNCHEDEIKYREDGEPVAFGVARVAIPYE